MKRYCLEQDKLKKKIYITVGGLFGRSKIKTFDQNEYQRAMEFVKQLGSKNRPSRVSMLDGQGNVSRQWEYAAKQKPRSYETSPRKKK